MGWLFTLSKRKAVLLEEHVEEHCGGVNLSATSLHPSTMNRTEVKQAVAFLTSAVVSELEMQPTSTAPSI